jgi:SAM-dependent methyltransferase
MEYEELNEIRKMTRSGFAEAKEAEVAADADGKQHQPTETEEAARLTEAKALGYTDEELALVPRRIDIGSGCGNVLAAAEIKTGEAVLVVGYRTGADIFIAASRVGTSGSVVGIEEAADEVTTAREAAREHGFEKVEIRVGENENLPVADKSFDLAVTNCAVTYSFDALRVVKEIARAVKPGGRVILCEPVFAKEAPKESKTKARRSVECLENALDHDSYKHLLKKAGLKKITVIDETSFPKSRLENDAKAAVLQAEDELGQGEINKILEAVTVVKIKALKP